MFGEFFKLELRSAFKSPMVYIFFFLIALMAFGAVASDGVQIGGAVGNVYKNSPHTLTNYVLILGIFGLLFAAAFFNSAALRDHNNQFNEIMFSLPIKKSGYFWGRFLGALVLSSIPLMGVFFGAWLGALIGPAAGWLDADRIGPFFFETIVANYFMFILPNMFIAGSIIFFLAHRFKSTIISFVGAMALIVVYLASGTFLSDIDNETLAGLVDMFAFRTYSVYSRYFTPAERNTLSPGFEGIIMQNRLLWLTIGVVVSIISFKVFSFREKMKFRKKKGLIPEVKTVVANISRPSVNQNFKGGLGWLQFKSFFTTSFLSIVKSSAFKILSIFGIILLFVSLLEGYDYFGLQSYPVTYKVIDDIAGATGLFLIIILVFFSGELVWRDRTSNIQEVINATPHSTFASVLAKMSSLVVSVTLLQVIFIFMGILSQIFRGYTAIELDIYFIDFFVDTLPGYIVFAAIFVFIQTLTNNRYIGYFTGILFFITWELIGGLIFEWRSNMLFPGGAPGIFYSDMSGFGPGMTGTLWFNLYWFLFAIILLATAALLWPRSAVSGFKEKYKMAIANFSGSYRNGMIVLAAVWIAVGGWVFYNTQILNSYNSIADSEQLVVDYELAYKKYENHPLPVMKSIKYEIDIHPDDRDVFVRANAIFENDEDVAIDSIFFNLSQAWDTEISIPGAELAMNDTILGFQIYTMSESWQPGEKKEISIKNDYVTKGFSNSQGNTSIVSNGTFLNNFSVMPGLGYSANAELSDKNDRKKFGLPRKKRTPDLEENCGVTCNSNYITGDISHWVEVESIISTSIDQIAVAPGSLIKEWEEDGRKYFHYKLDQPSLNFYNFMSARYEVAREKYNDIDIEIYYHPGHEVNVPKMISAVRKSLAYYEENFGPYYHKQARILEFPRFSTFAQAFPGTMPYSESFGFITNLEDETENNVVDAVIAHEMAHQWWAHQEVPADMQGGTMLTESFAEYSSLMTLRQESDDMKMKNFMKYDYNRYLRGRTSESEKELPLYKVENQGYIHYGKGSVILYALQDYIGADSVNAALRSFLEEYRYAEPPYPNSHDFLRHLEPRVPDSLNYLINDWFKEITLYDLRLEEARMTKLDNGQYEVEMDVMARKMYADTLGNETQVALKEWIDIGVYADSDEEELMAWKRVKFDEENSTVTIIVDSVPAKAAIDPRRILIERITDDNVKSVSLE
ncbi:MAG: ABC-2 type transport system permease protein [Cryomorphaceae bacterium]|jgi:ABC-2 type transport system permease protein